MAHVFKLTKNGFLVCNDRYIKVRDEKGFVNYFGKLINYKESDLQRCLKDKLYMDYSVHIPQELILRALPVNVELIELIREK
jgi:hypothetical protein